MLVLESMQAGLSWITILKKREYFREAFDGFDPHKIIFYDDLKIQVLMSNESIIRNRLKINATISKAKISLNIVEKYGSFDKMIWAYVNNMPITGHFEKIEDLPATTPLSDKISKDLKNIGFKFLGSTTIYAFMQATGMVNDHLKSCYVYEELLDDKLIDTVRK